MSDAFVLAPGDMARVQKLTPGGVSIYMPAVPEWPTSVTPSLSIGWVGSDELVIIVAAGMQPTDWTPCYTVVAQAGLGLLIARHTVTP